MKIRQQQVAAALAAVDLYLRQEEAETLAAQETFARRAASEPGVWAQAGRLDAMSMRRLMQMRAFAPAR
jgi:predicted nucleic acid-binding Zn ribbon protein